MAKGSPSAKRRSERDVHVDITLLLLYDVQYGLSENSRQCRCIFYSAKVWPKPTLFARKTAPAPPHSQHRDVVRRNKAGKDLLFHILGLMG